MYKNIINDSMPLTELKTSGKRSQKNENKDWKRAGFGKTRLTSDILYYQGSLEDLYLHLHIAHFRGNELRIARNV